MNLPWPRFRASVATALACSAAPLHAQETGGGPGRAPDAPLLIARAWSPAASVTMAFPTSAGTYREGLLARASDLALLAAIREATAELPVQLTHASDGTGRYFVAVAAPEAVESVLQALQRAARTPLPARLVDNAVAGMRGDLAFRGDLPRSRFDRIMDARLRGEGGAIGAVTEAAAVIEGIAAEVTSSTPAVRWGPPAWVVVGDGDPFPAEDTAASPLPVALEAPARVPESLRDRVPGDAVTLWVGSAYRFPPGTTLVEACFVRLVLETMIEDRRDPDLFEFDSEIDALGRLVVRLSTSAHAAGSWEARLDDAIDRLGSESGGAPLDRILPRVRSRWSRRLAPAAGAGRAAAEALLRGATDTQAAAFAKSAATPPAAERIRAAARQMTLAIRVVHGGG